MIIYILHNIGTRAYYTYRYDCVYSARKRRVCVCASYVRIISRSLLSYTDFEDKRRKPIATIYIYATDA